VAKPPGTVRVVVVGDSVTFGTSVRIEDVFHKAAERTLNDRYGGRPRVEVWGMGVGGANTTWERRVIQLAAPRYSPDLVVLAFNLNDVQPILEWTEAALAANGLPRDQGWKRFVCVRCGDAYLRGQSHLYHYLRNRLPSLTQAVGLTREPRVSFDLDWESEESLRSWQRMALEIAEIQAFLSARGIPLAVLVIPMDMQTGEAAARFYREEARVRFSTGLVNGLPQKIIGKFLAGADIPCIDPLPAFRADGSQKFLRRVWAEADYNHPNDRGHRLLGDALERYVGAWIAGRPRV